MANKYLNWSINHKQERSIIADKERLRNHLLPVLGDRNPAEITSREIHSLLNSLIGQEKTYSYLKTLGGQSVKFITEDKILYWLSKMGYKKLNISLERVSELKAADLKAFLIAVTGNEKIV